MLYKSWVGGLLYPAFQADKSAAVLHIHIGHYVLQAQITAEAYLTLAETNNYCRTIHRLLYNETLFLLPSDALQCPKPVRLWSYKSYALWELWLSCIVLCLLSSFPAGTVRYLSVRNIFLHLMLHIQLPGNCQLYQLYHTTAGLLLPNAVLFCDVHSHLLARQHDHNFPILCWYLRLLCQNLSGHPRATH